MPNILSVVTRFATGVNNPSYSVAVDADATILVVVLSTEDTSSDKVIGITYDGDALTQALEHDYAGGEDLVQSFWYLVNPSTGSNTLAFDTDGNSVNDMIYVAYSLDDVDLDNPIHATNTKNIGSGSPNVNITTTIDDTLLIDSFGSEASDDGDFTVGSGQTQRELRDFGSDVGGISDKPAATAGTYTMEWDFVDDDEETGSAVIAIAPAGGAAEITKTHTTDAFTAEDDSQSRTHNTDSLLRKENTRTHSTSASIEAPETVQFIGFETGGTEEAIDVTGTVSVQSSIKRTGDYALRANPTSGTGIYRIGGNIDPGDTDIFFEQNIGASVWIYIADTPSADTIIFQTRNSTTGNIAVKLHSDGTLGLYNGATQLGSDSDAVDEDTWVRLEVKVAFSSSVGTAAASINGNEFASESSLNNSNGASDIRIGVIDSTTADIYFDDFFIHNVTDFPGSKKIFNLKANGVGDRDEWAGTFADVDDIPISEADARTSSTVDDRFTNAVEDISTHSIDGDRITAIKEWAWWKSDDATGEVALLLRSGFLDIGGAGINSTTSQFLASVRSEDLSSDSWTGAIVDDLEIGLDVQVAPSTGSVRGYAVGIMVAEAEDITPRFTKTHNTDSILRDQNTQNHTTSANLKQAGNELTHSTDAFLKMREDLDHSTDALLRDRNSENHTTDALLRDTDTKNHTADSFLRVSATDSHTTDSLLKDQIGLTHTADSFLQDRNSLNHTTDLLLRSAEEITHTTDALLRTREDLDHTTDAFLKQTESVSHTGDSLLRASDDVSHGTDTLLRSQQDTQHDTDTLLRLQDDVEHTTDAFMAARAVQGHTADSNLRDILTAQHTTSAAIRVRDTVEHTTDSLLNQVETATHSTDAFLRKAETVDHTADSNLREVIDITHSTDSSILGENAQSHGTDALLRDVVEQSHTTDAFLLAERQLSHTTDSNLKQADIEITHTTDSTLTTAGTLPHTTDTVLNNRGFQGHTTNSLLRASDDLTHTTDSVLKRTFEKDHDTDALLRVRTQLTHTADSVLSVRATESHTTDSYIILQAVKTHSTDSSIQNNVRTSHTTDTTLAVRDTRDHTTDSTITNRFTQSHSTDARLYCNPKRPTIVVEVNKPVTEFTLVVKATTMYNQNNKPTTVYKEC